MLAGRKIGQVQKLFSPVTPQEEKQAENGKEKPAIHRSEANPSRSPSATPGKPRFEVRVDVQVDKSAKVYRDARVRMMQLGLLGRPGHRFHPRYQHSAVRKMVKYSPVNAHPI